MIYPQILELSFNALRAEVFQLSKQAARPSLPIVAAPSRICALRFRTYFVGFEAERVLGDGKIAANRAAWVGLSLAGVTPK